MILLPYRVYVGSEVDGLSRTQFYTRVERFAFLSKISSVGKQHDYLASVKTRTSKKTKSKV